MMRTVKLMRDSCVSSEKGFSVAELMIVVLVAGILAVIATPMLINFSPNRDLNGMTQEIVSLLQRARLEAASRGINCTVVFNATINGDNYAMALFADADNNDQFGAGDTFIAGMSAATYQDAFFDNTESGGDGIDFPLNGAGDNAISWDFRGRPDPAAFQPPNAATLSVFLTNRDNQDRQIDVSVAGTVRVAQ